MRKYLWFFLSLLFMNSVFAQDGFMNILSRKSSSDEKSVLTNLSSDEKLWLKHKKRLILAVPKEEYPPHDIKIRSGGETYEGLTADVIGVISSNLKIDFVAKSYPSRSAALLAIKKGEADLIGAANDYEFSQGLRLTSPYAHDTPSIYGRLGMKLEDVHTLAVPQDYLSSEFINTFFPGKKILYYSGVYSAIASVAYKISDAVIVDTISANFLVNKLYQDSLQLLSLIPFKSQGFAFAVANYNTILTSILNQSIEKLNDVQKDEMYQRWSGGGISLSSNRLNLSEDEIAYLRKKKNLTIILNSRIPPFAYADENGNFRGVLADIVQAMKLSLGIEINVIMTKDKTLSEQVKSIASGSADLTILSSFGSNEYGFLSSRSVMLDPLVYVLRKGDLGKYSDFRDVIKAGPIGVRKGGVSESILEYYKDESVQVVYTSNLSICVVKKECLATLLPLRLAQYSIDNEFPDSLAIAGELYDSEPIAIVFSANKNNQVLIDVINKFLSSIPPNEIDFLPSRWRVSPASDDISFNDIFRHFGASLISIVITLILMVFWTISLRRQNRKRRLAETKLKQQLKFMGELVDSIPHPIFARNEQGDLILCNSSFSLFHRKEKEEFIGGKYVELPLSEQSMSELGKVYNEIYRTGQPYEGDHQVLLMDGRTFYVYYWLHAYRDLSGNISGVVGGWIDISDRHALMNDLSEASNRAEEANKAKSTFLATMSHEIRTPMNAIIGLLELTLRKENISAEARESISVAHNSALDLLSLIGDILDISKIESGKLELAPAPHSIAELSRSVFNVFTANARAKGLMLTCNITDDEIVMIDPVRYKQIISNLISNAIKFTREGSVTLALKLQSTGDVCCIKIIVSDTGIGISEQDQNILFQPFSQATQPTDVQRSGTGLGLMISRTLCQMMGGSLELESELGKGTTISVSICLETVALHSDNTKIDILGSNFEPSARSHHILIIDDHPTNRLLLNQQLTFLKHEVVMAESGKDALAKLADQYFDIIITDFNMPDMDGLEFTTHYRQQELQEKRKRSVIIGLTADARQEQMQNATLVGMDDCLFKPVSLDELENCLAKYDFHQDADLTISIADRIDEVIHSLAPGNAVSVYPLLEAFMLATQEDLVALAEASNNNDCRRFLDHLHRIKGGARIIGVDQLVACCIEWEQSPRLAWCMPSALRQLQEVFEQVQKGVNYWRDTRGV
ncbi:ATP-binding protein [Aeromonas cavernicola]|uniref:histidine kinase n=1 Tax=Aeromonas cavernicola TaxID=1006623 RepID=A0A2H9U3T9_9GAMM|nr:transporter substrate-binding domain-containing protein [Aeromonas cavernicola]PJG58695.1 histidine kinase [Aeromonas cavernicola]